MQTPKYERRFLSHDLICIPTFDRPEGICDFVFQTALDLAGQNVVIILALGENWRGVSGWKRWRLAVTATRQKVSVNSSQNEVVGTYIYLGLYQFLPFQRFSIIKKLNLQLNLFLLRVLALDKAIAKHKLLWLFHPQDSQVLQFFDLKKWQVHFDVVDWSTSSVPLRKELLDRQRQKILEVASSVTVLTKPLQQKIKKMFNRPLALVPQGFDLTGFTSTETLPRSVAKDLKKLQLKRKPLVGFFGGINSRLDINLLKQVVSSARDIEFLFVGPRESDDSVRTSSAQEVALDELLAQPNVSRFLPLERKYLLHLMEACAVLTIPYDLSSEFNRCCFPMKVMEYFYVGRPVVATPIPSLLNYAPHVITAQSSMSYVKALRTALKSKPTVQQRSASRKIALTQTWTKKLDCVDEYLNKMIRSS